MPRSLTDFIWFYLAHAKILSSEHSMSLTFEAGRWSFEATRPAVLARVTLTGTVTF